MLKGKKGMIINTSSCIKILFPHYSDCLSCFSPLWQLKYIYLGFLSPFSLWSFSIVSLHSLQDLISSSFGCNSSSRCCRDCRGRPKHPYLTTDFAPPCLGVPPDTDYPQISASESPSNPDTDIIFSHPSIFVSVSVSER